MLFGRVRGTAVCTIKHPDLIGKKLLLVEPVDRHLNRTGPLQIAVDVVHAGPNDLCVMVRSREAALAMTDNKFVPVDLALIGIVDELSVREDGEIDLTMKKGTTRYS